MNSRERVASAMRHEPVDRVPVMCQLALGYYFLHSPENPADIWFDSAVFARTLEETCRKHGFDGFLVNLPGRPPDWRQRLISEEDSEDDSGNENQSSGKLTWDLGFETVFPPDDNPQTMLRGGKNLPRVACHDVDLRDPRMFRGPGYLWNIWHAPTLWDLDADADLTDSRSYPDWFTRGLALAREACPDLSVHVEVFSPFTHLMELLGYEEGLMSLLDDPKTCLRALDTFTSIAVAQVDCYAAHDPDAVLISSAFAGAGFISRLMYQEFVLPFEHRVAEAVNRHGITSYVHTCGPIGDRLDLMAETDVAGIDTLDPPPLGSVDLIKAKEEFGDRLFFKGNLDAVVEMLLGDDAAFEAAVRQRISIGGPGSGYILSSACSVAPRVAPERLDLMVAISREIGTPWTEREG